MLTDISTATLRKMVKLSERKEALMAQIQKIDREMAALQRGSIDEATRRKGRSAPAESRSAEPRRQSAGPRGKRGALKESILQLLRNAGKSGTTIREISDQLGVKTANLYVWFNGTGKTVSGLRKIGPATYRLGD